MKRSRLVTAVCVALLGLGVGACDEGGGADAGLDGATSSTDSGTGSDAGDPGPCPAGAFDLEALADAEGFTLVEAGSVELNVSGTLFGNPSMHSDTIYLCVPDDIVSFAVLVDSSAAAEESTGRQVFPTVFSTPDDGDLIDSNAAGPDDLLGSPAFPDVALGQATILHPRVPENSISGGRHALELGVEGGATSVDLYFAVRRGTTSADVELRANLIFVNGHTMTPDEIDDLQTMVSEFDDRFNAVGISFAEFGVGQIDATGLAVGDGEYDHFAALVNAPIIDITPSGTLLDDAVNVYIISEVGGYGVSMGIPGMLGINQPIVGNGVVIAVTEHIIEDPGGDYVDIAEMWRTIAHEAGHWLGLNHTTEQDGSAHDPITDTSECPLSADANDDGELTTDECVGAGGQYMMFWEGKGSEISAHQAQILRANPLAEPL